MGIVNGRIQAGSRTCRRDSATSITSEDSHDSSAVMHPKGSVILLRDAGIGTSAILGADMAVSQHFMAWSAAPD